MDRRRDRRCRDVAHRAGGAKRGRLLFDGARAAEFGVVQWSLPRLELPAFASALAARIAALPKAALAANKRCVAAALDPARDGYFEELRETRALYDHPETRRKVSAFLAPRGERSVKAR